MTDNSADTENGQPWRLYICRACGFVYDESKGDPDSGLAPGTRYEDIPDDWECPLCGVTKTDFELFEKQKVDVSSEPLQPSQGTGIVVVGAGLAGWATVEAIRALDASVPLTLVTACDGDVYHKPELSIAISRGMTRDSLVRERGADAARRLGVRLMRDTFAVGLSPVVRQLRTTRGTLSYTKLVLAQGAKPALPPMLPPGLCWRVNDLAGWTGVSEKLAAGPARVAIVGAGMVGCELAEDLAAAGHSVTLLDRERLPLAGLLPREAAQRLRDNFGALGVEFMGGAEITDVSEDDSGVRRIGLGGGGVVLADHVIAATGLETDNLLARQAGLAFNRGIQVNPETLSTSDPDIYALGDCVSLYGQPCRFIEPIPHQAKTIARAALGLDAESYRHSDPVIRLKTKSLPIVVHGVPKQGGSWRVVRQGLDCLEMEQRMGGTVTSTLRVGKAA
jgi:rubredoxin-NAD+ reductase